MDWQTIAPPVLHFFTVFCSKFLITTPLTQTWARYCHPLKSVFYFLLFFLDKSALPSMYCRMPSCQPLPEHTLFLSWGASAKQTWNSVGPRRISYVYDILLKRWFTSTFTLPASLCPISCFQSHRLFLSLAFLLPYSISYSAAPTLVWNPPQLGTFPCRQLYCT